MRCPGCERLVEPGEIECQLCGEDLTGPATLSGSPQPEERRAPVLPDRFLPQPAPQPSSVIRPLSANMAVAGFAAVLLFVLGAGSVVLFRHLGGDRGGTAVTEQHNGSSDGRTTAGPSPEPPPWTSTGEPAPRYPPLSLPGKECVREGTGPYAAAAAGTTLTSCSFAINVRHAYLSSGSNRTAVILEVYSPMTGLRYMMSCTGDQPVVCSGGNQAVVYLYGGTATFTG
jgi:hypothetical protein